MNLFFRSGIVGFVLLGFLTAAPPAVAEPVVITDGFIGQTNGIDLPGFDISGNGSRFTGILPIAGIICCTYNAGDTVTLNASFPLSSLPWQPTPQVVNGTSYHSFVSGFLTFTSTPFVAPPFDGSRRFGFSTPFTMRGEISGFSEFQVPGQSPLFTVSLTGSGTAGLDGSAFATTPNYIGQSLGFRFSAGPSPTPEPASMLLVGSGVAAIAAVKRRRNTRAVRRH